MQFHIPQFIEIEDRIIGPFTLKQFIYIAGGVGASFVIYSIIPNLIIAIFFIIPFAGLAILLAFFPINNRPFEHILEAAFKHLTKNKLYLWRKEKRRVSKEKAVSLAPNPDAQSTLPKISGEKLDDLSWSLDVKTEIDSDKISFGNEGAIS